MKRSELYSTSDIGKLLNLNVRVEFIQNVLGIQPDFESHLGCFWKRSKLQHLLFKMTQHFSKLEQECASGAFPSDEDLERAWIKK